MSSLAWELIFIGQDKYGMRGQFDNYLRDKDLRDRIFFISNADRIRVKKLLGDSDIFILSSLIEVLPIAALEAMAMSLPCILTDVGGCSEIIKDGYNGYLVRPEDPHAIADKLLYLSKNNNLLKQMGENARKTVLEKFDLRGCVGKYMAVFDKAV
jgi:N,N'-diacetylbacillosaminyl-diphospho-undecaprenol alpha-1,3-N-acetylgalactosaminyltransferase